MFKKTRHWPINICVTFMLTISVLVCINVTEVGLYIVFTITAIFLVLSINWLRFSWFYNYFVLFIVLGFWLKITIHQLYEYDYVEPIGYFSGKTEQWETIYILISLAYLGVILAKVLFSIVDIKLSIDLKRRLSRPLHNSAWVKMFLFVTLVYLVNLLGGFYVVGIEPKYIFPYGLSAIISFIVIIGVGIIITMFVHHELQCTGKIGGRAISLMLFHGLLASVSTASRATMIVQTLPMLLGSLKEQSEIGRYKIRKNIFITFGIITLLSLTIVSLYRIQLYMDTVITEDLLLEYMQEILKLFVDRWVGAEAVMVSSSLDIKSMDLFYSLMLEPPGMGVNGIYQQLSGSNYQSESGRVFLTLPGLIGLTSFSGSGFVVSFVTFLAVFISLLIEKLLSFFISGNQVSMSLLGCTLANVLCQMNNLYLLGVFIFEIILFVVIISFFIRRLSKEKITI